jgi:hypothetical protein
VGSGSLASEKCLRTGKSQSGVSRTLWFIQEMPLVSFSGSHCDAESNSM